MKKQQKIAALLAAVILFSACNQTGAWDSSEGTLSSGGSSQREDSSSREDSSEEPSSDDVSLQDSSADSSEEDSSAAGIDSSKTGTSSKQNGTSSKAAAASAPAVKPNVSSKANVPQPDTSGVVIPPAGNYTGAINIHLPSAAGTTVYGDGVSTIDASNAAQGYFMFMTNYSGGKRLKLKVVASATYYYDISPGVWYTFPLQMGNGNYEINVMENTTDTKYRKIFGQTISVALASSLSPYLYPNQFVNYTSSSSAIRKSFDLCVNAKNEVQKVAAIYNYVTTHIKYDSAKASSVQSGYLPNVDSTLASGTGICFDYAALTAAMLRAQGIPTRLAVGTKSGMSHAWNYIYMKETGWIAVKISYSAGKWNFADTTFAAGGVIPSESNGYTTLRIY